MPPNLYELMQRRAAEHPDAIAFGGQDDLIWRTLTSRTALGLVDRLAVELGAAGAREGDRVLLWAPNHWRTPIYLFALWKLGAIPVPFDREMNPEAGAQILDSIDPRLILVGYGERPAWARERKLTEWWEPGARSTAEAPADEWTPAKEDIAAIFFTSGTTGVPKGCVITHSNLVSQVEALKFTIPLDTNSRLASILPLSHLFELTVGMLYPLSCGAAIHYTPSRRGPDIVRVLAEQRITHMIAVPQFLTLMGGALHDRLRSKLPVWPYEALSRIASRLPLAARRGLFWFVHRELGGHLRMIASGGAALQAETQLLWERLGVRIVQGYGVSECSPVIACGAGDGSTPVGSVGRPLRGVEVRTSAEGELLVRGPNVMRGYWKDQEKTQEVLQDGWYSTGDLVTFDSAGNIRLSGRAKDLIALPSGMKVWPQDVEDALRSDPAIADAAVIAVPSPSGGATLHAYLLPASPTARASDLGTLIARCNGRLAQHQRLATASWWPEPDFPRTPIGKVRRNLLSVPEDDSAVKVDSLSAMDDPVALAIAGVAKASAVRDDQKLGALGLDSFGLVELSLALQEKTGRAVSDGDLTAELTVAQVRAVVENSAPAEDMGGGVTIAQEGAERQPLWPYTWGRAFRFVGFPIELIYRAGVTKTIVIGAANLERLPRPVIFAGTHHSFADLPLVRFALAHSPSRVLAARLIVAVAARGWKPAGFYATYGRLALGLYPLEQLSERDASLRGLVRAAAAGNCVLIFPQGVHALPQQERAGDPAVQFRPGVAHLTRALGAVVVPFGLAGTEQRIPYTLEGFHGKVIAGIPVSLRRGPLAIAFGPPLRLEPGEDAHAFTSRLQDASYELTREAEAALVGQTGKSPQHP